MIPTIQADTRSITIEDLVFGFFHENRGCEAVTFIAETDPKLRKTGNPLGEVRKIAKVNGMINWVYSNAVNRQREREGVAGVFASFPRKWGERLEGTPLIAKDEFYYLELKVQRSIEYAYVDADGRELDPELVAPFLPKRSRGRQGVEREVILRDYKLNNIKQIRIRGETYRIEG
jgi:hypothetical protein